MESDNLKTIQNPWQITPTRLISYGVEHAEKKGEFNHQVAFLLLDVGVETLFKVYLDLPDVVTNVNLPYAKRKEAIDGSFHKLIDAIKTATDGNIDDDLEKVRNFHKIRNKIYHQGDGVTVVERNLSEYVEIAQELLKTLISVDLNETTEDRSETVEDSLDDFDREWTAVAKYSQASRILEVSIDELKTDLAVVVAFIRSNWIKRSRISQLQEIVEEYPDIETDDYETRYENKTKRTAAFYDFAGKQYPRKYDWFVQLSLEDISYLYLALVFQENDKNWVQGVEKYQAVCKFLEEISKRKIVMFSNSNTEVKANIDYCEKTFRLIEQEIEWVWSIQELIESFLENFLPSKQENREEYSNH